MKKFSKRNPQRYSFATVQRGLDELIKIARSISVSRDDVDVN